MADFSHSRGDSSLSVQTPEGIEFILYPAGLPARACAWAVDSLIQGALFFAILIAAGILSLAFGFWFSLILIFVLNWFYHTAFEIFCRGQSPGKKLVGIRVVRGDGSPANPGSSFLRNLLRFADTFMFLYLIAFICMLASPGFRRLGDWAADTLVVYTDYARSPGRFSSPALRRSGMPWLAGVPAVSPSRKLGYEEKQAVLSFARRYPFFGKARADEIAQIWTAKLRPLGGKGAPIPARPAEGPVPDGAPCGLGAGPGDSGAGASDADFLLGIARALGG